MGDGASHGGIAGERVGAVDFSEIEVGEIGDQARDVAAGGVDFDRDGDGVAVVFDDEEDGELALEAVLSGFPEFALLVAPSPSGDVDDLVAVEVDFAELRGSRPGMVGGFGMAAEDSGRLRRSRQPAGLGAGGGRRGDDVELAAAQWEGIWRPPRGGIGGRADGLEQLLFGGDAEGEAEGAVAIVGEEPVVAGAQSEGGGDQQGLVAGAGDLEEDLLLALEQISRSSMRRERS